MRTAPSFTSPAATKVDPDGEAKDAVLSQLVQALSAVKISRASAAALISAIEIVTHHPDTDNALEDGYVIDDGDDRTVLESRPPTPAPPAATAAATSASAAAPAAILPSAPASPTEDAPESAIGTNQPDYYYVPQDNAVGPFYVVTRGLFVGVFSGWPSTSPYVSGVPHAVYVRTSSAAAGKLLMEQAYNAGSVNQVN